MLKVLILVIFKVKVEYAEIICNVINNLFKPPKIFTQMDINIFNFKIDWLCCQDMNTS